MYTRRALEVTRISVCRSANTLRRVEPVTTWSNLCNLFVFFVIPCSELVFQTDESSRETELSETFFSQLFVEVNEMNEISEKTNFSLVSLV